MPLSAGQKLGPYEILSPIGAGGMGEVYKARDTRLDRSVAIKVLPEHIAQREDLRARFEREARAVASLNHPNICTLHDIGNENGAGYMVMEHLEGETLAARIEKGAIPLDQALTIATQIADALDRAHRAGVTHRDVKPQNIMLTRDGVKVLDFGLAKAATRKPGPTEETITNSLTVEGKVVGTPQYMSPEQFEGEEADARSDIWAFGAVLYEMVTGQKAFRGATHSSLASAIFGTEPPPMAVKPFTPAWLEKLVRRCLAKDPEERYYSMHDIVLDLRSPPQETTATGSKPSRWPWAIAAASAIAVAALAWILWQKKPDASPVVTTTEITPPEGSRFGAISNTGGSVISPDGRTLAFVATNAKSETLLHVQPLDSLAARALPGTEDAGRPFWSPDGKSLAFVAGGKLKRVDLAGGAPVALCDARYPRGGAWSADGVILFADQQSGLQRIPASGGTPVAVTKMNPEAGARHYYPQLLPDGRFLYLVRSSAPEKMGIFIGALDGRPPVKIVQTEFKAAYDAASGRLLYVRKAGTLTAQKLELDPPRLTDEPVAVAETVGFAPTNGYADFSVSRSGTLLYGKQSLVSRRFAWRDRTGRVLETIGQPMDAAPSFRLSPGGDRVAYVKVTGSEPDVGVMDLARGLSTRLTFSGALGPIWSPDGKRIYFSTFQGIQWKAADGSGDQALTEAGRVFVDVPQSISPDGKYLLYGVDDILALPLTGERKPVEYVATKAVEFYASFSPDGRWVAYVSNESGRSEIYVQGFPERRGKWLISAAGGNSPHWRGDGKELYWIGSDSALMAATVELQAAAIRPGQPEPLFRQTDIESTDSFQPSRDGRKFLVLEPEGGQRNPSLVLVQNWAAGLAK